MQDQVGRVIGRQGKTIKRLEAESGASLRVRDAGPGRQEGDAGPAKVVISGDAASVASAKERILALVSEGAR
ncbi:hypothetical protein T484DRAFT_1818468 [Baffinella frigidus]|nr:hypothetical protein T484DRAFT_1818468 [Cryptophyta sp. CCMP2293]